MKILTRKSLLCNINGCSIEVPTSVNYITIDFNGNCETWVNKPFLYDGFWINSSEISTCICRVELDDNDVWTHAFDVKKQRFLTMADAE